MQNQKYKNGSPTSPISGGKSDSPNIRRNDIGISDFQVNIRKSDILIVIIILGLILPNFSLAQEQLGAVAPQTMGEAKDFAMSILLKLPEAVERVWKEEALPTLIKMWEWVKPLIDPLWQKFLGLLGKEIKQQFQEEKSEIQKDLWERFKGLLK